MKKRLLFLCLILSSYSNAQLSDWLIGIDSSINVRRVVTDDFGDVYFTGICRNNGIAFNGTNYSSATLYNPYNLGYVAKVDSVGNLIWARTIGTQNIYDISLLDIMIDNKNNVIVLAEFYDSLKVENDTLITLGPPSFSFRTQNALIKFDKMGNFKWASVVPGESNWKGSYWHASTNIAPSFLRADSLNHIHVSLDTASNIARPGLIYSFDQSGNYLNSFNRAGITQEFIIDKHGNKIIAHTADTMFIRYDSLGNILSIFKYTGYNNLSVAKIELDDFDNLFVLGTYVGSIKIGGYALNSNAFQLGGFLMKMNSSGQVLWVLDLYDCTSPSSNPPFLWGLNGLNIDKNGEILVCGNFYKEICHRGENFVAPTIKDSSTIFLFNFDPSGLLLWAKYGFGEGHKFPAGIARKGENVYMSIVSYHRFSQVMDTVHFDALTALGNKGLLYKLKAGGNLITGKVFVDSNANTLPNAGDRFIPNQVISINSSHAISQKDGAYKAYVPQGSYSIALPVPKRHHSATPLAHSASFSAFNQIDSANHFILALNPGINDMAVRLIPGKAYYFGNVAYLDFEFTNRGSTTLSDSVKLLINPALTYKNGNLAPDVTTSNSMTWAYKLKPYESKTVKIEFKIKSAPSVSVLDYSAVIYPIVGDAYIPDNTDSASQRVVGAYDPNDKLVKPEGDVNPIYVQDEKFFTYTVRFQNTGNTAASYVRIRDTISGNLKIETFEFLGASHDYRIELINPNVFDFIFENINLPDSGSDLQGSTGYIQYRIKADPGLKHGDFIENTAHIYFDNNEAVVTNTTHTLISDWASIKKISDVHQGIYLFPNPAKDAFRIKLIGSNSAKVDLIIRDLAGRIVYNRNDMPVNGDEIFVSNLSLSTGIYFVEIQSEMLKLTSKLIVK